MTARRFLPRWLIGYFLTGYEVEARTELIREIDTFLAKVKITDTAIGLIALGDPSFVRRLRRGERKRCWPETARKVREFMAAAYTMITTADGTVIVRDLKTGVTASGRSLAEAYAELRLLLSQEEAA